MTRWLQSRHVVPGPAVELRLPSLPTVSCQKSSSVFESACCLLGDQREVKSVAGWNREKNKCGHVLPDRDSIGKTASVKGFRGFSPRDSDQSSNLLCQRRENDAQATRPGTMQAPHHRALCDVSVSSPPDRIFSTSEGALSLSRRVRQGGDFDFLFPPHHAAPSGAVPDVKVVNSEVKGAKGRSGRSQLSLPRGKFDYPVLNCWPLFVAQGFDRI